MQEEGKSKLEFLEQAAQIQGVYVPAFYDVTYNVDGTVKAYPPHHGAPATVKKRNMMDMDKSYLSQRLCGAPHRRGAQPHLRGSAAGLHPRGPVLPGWLFVRPYREKSIETIDRQCRDLCCSTGYDEISLSSLSTSDYSQLNQLIDTLHQWTEGEKVSLSLPSLRVDNFSPELMERINSVRKSGLTFAPEAGSQRMRDVINKNVTEEQLLHTVNVAFTEGWTRIKLYFMIGLPTETIEDVIAIDELGQKVVDAFYQNKEKPRAKGWRCPSARQPLCPSPSRPSSGLARTHGNAPREAAGPQGERPLPQAVRQLPRRPDQLFGGRVRPWGTDGCAP